MPYKKPYKTNNRAMVPVRKRPAKKGLTKTEVKQTKKIAERVLNTKTESKYFRCVGMGDLNDNGLGQPLYPARSSYNQMYVLGYSTATGARLDGISTYKYGISGAATKSIQALGMARTFGADETNDELVGNALDGNYATPSMASTEWNIQRLFDQVSSETTSKDVAPYFVRIVRLVPRPKKGSYQDVDPETDAFLDEFSRETGVLASTFTNYELQMLKLNTKKYQVKADIKFMMTPAVIFNESAPDYQATVAPGTHQKFLSFRHDIGKRLYYDNPEGTGYPTDGMKQEFILFHVCHIGLGNSASSNQPNGLRLGCKAVSTFKDF